MSRRPLEAREVVSVESTPPTSTALGSVCPKSSEDSVVFDSGSNSVSATGTSGLALSPTALSEVCSFAEFRKVITKAIAEPSIYGSYEGRTFIVPAKLKEIHHFNIAKVKRKRRKGKDGKKADKQYEFVMRCRLVGPEAADGSIVCQLASSLLVPFFGVAPYEMRKMHRENKAEANKIVAEKGNEVLSELSPLAPLHMQLLLSREEFFKQEQVPDRIDGESAIVLVCSRDDA